MSNVELAKLQEKIKARILGVMDDNGLLLSSTECHFYTKKLNNFIGKEDLIKNQTLGREFSFVYNRMRMQKERDILHYVEHFPRVINFGYSLGYQLS